MKPASFFEQQVGPAIVLTVPVLGDNFSYLIVTEGIAAAVDPADAAPLIGLIKSRRLRLELVLNTHHHFDHVAGNRELKAATACRIVGPDDPRIPGLDQPVRDNDRLSLGPLSIEILGTPGHTRSHVCYFLPSGPALWSGDTLFTGGCGRLIENGAATMWGSLNTLATLPDETRVFCGHDYAVENLQFAAELEPGNTEVRKRLAELQSRVRKGQPTVPSTLAEERATNPFLQHRTPAALKQLGLEGKTPSEVFAEIRRRKDAYA
jgi:hydroxyacylglutathione hydrolase